MQDNLEVFFCDFCNASVPQRDLDNGAASRIRGRVIGQCCLAEVRGAAPVRHEGSATRAGSFAVGMVLLAAITGVAVFFDWRLSTEANLLQGRLAELEGGAREQQERLPRIEARLADDSASTEVAQLRTQVEGFAHSAAEREAQLSGSLAGMNERFGQVERWSEEVRQSFRQQNEDLRAVAGDVNRLSREVEAALARQLAPPETSSVPAPAAAAAAKPADLTDAPAAAAAAALPAELARQVDRLDDTDAGARFEAVDQLIRSKNPAVLGALLAAAADADLFVRRLTVEGLAEFHDAAAVDALIAALVDPEKLVRDTAYASLRKLTGQDIAYDPDSRADRAGQRRWQQWWEKNKVTF